MSIVGVQETNIGTQDIAISVISRVPKFEFEAVSLDRIIRIMEDLDIGKAAGLDNISPFIWKETRNESAHHVMVLFNSIIEKSIFPSRLKEGFIYPLHKGGSKSLPLNYRPVSVPNVLSKIIETELHDQLSEHLRVNGLIDIFQYGFVKGKGCTETIAKLTALTSKAIESKKSVVLISLDISKSFDTMNHDILLNKMNELNVGAKALKLTKSFLSDRTQFVRVDEALSEPGIIMRGVMQGTNLGPLLFSIYVSDMRLLLTNSKILKFADDTILFMEVDGTDDSAKIIKAN